MKLTLGWNGVAVDRPRTIILASFRMVKPPKHGVEAKADCTSQSFLPIVDAQFLQQIGTVGLHGSHGQAKTLRRFLIAEPKGIGLQQLAFSRGQLKRLATLIETIRLE